MIDELEKAKLHAWVVYVIDTDLQELRVVYSGDEYSIASQTLAEATYEYKHVHMAYRAV